MSSQRQNAAEKDLEKYIKFLALKSTQVVVQSRLGEKIQTQCNPLATGNDWFNIVVQDHPDVYAETKRALALGQGDSILQRLPLCVEISLKTVEGDQMVLEVWSLDLQPHAGNGLQKPNTKEKDEKIDTMAKGDTAKGGGVGGTLSNGTSTTTSNSGDQQTLRAAHAIYNRMGVLLKSLISLTRATPAYKLSRRQCSDSYGIYYRIYVDRPQVHTLGDGHKHVRIGQLSTIVGSLSMSVSYRTKMTITPTGTQMHTAEGNFIMVKSDHFRPADAAATPPQLLFGLTAGQKKTGFGGAADRKMIDIEKPLRPGAFTDVAKLRQYTEEDYVLPETPPFEWLLLQRTRHESGGGGSVESLNQNQQQQATNNTISNNNNANVCNNNNNNNIAAFKSFENGDNARQHEKPSATLSQSPPIKSLLIPAPPATRHSSAPNLPPATQPQDDDNLLKELNFPFASPTSHVNDLAKFYRDCYHAPPLRGLSELQPELGNCGSMAALTAAGSAGCLAVDDLSRQLEQFETSLEDYDKLVSQLGLTASSSTGSRSSGGLQMSN